MYTHVLCSPHISHTQSTTLSLYIDKPYTESVEQDKTKPDNEMAQLFLDQYQKRNQSFIHDLFRGQFKSTVVCPCCKEGIQAGPSLSLDILCLITFFNSVYFVCLLCS